MIARLMASCSLGVVAIGLACQVEAVIPAKFRWLPLSIVLVSVAAGGCAYAAGAMSVRERSDQR